MHNPAASPRPPLMTSGRFIKASSQYLTAGPVASHQTGDQPLTACVWAYFDSVTGPVDVMQRWGAVGYREWYIIANSGPIQFGLSSPSSGNTTVDGPSPVVGRWYFYAAYHDPVADTIGISVDGGAPATAAWSGGINSLAVAETTLASRHGSTSNSLSGRVGPAALYRRVLTPAEIAAMYRSGLATRYAQLPAWATEGLLSWWDVSEPGGVRLDSHGSAHMAPVNAPGSADGPPGVPETRRKLWAYPESPGGPAAFAPVMSGGFQTLGM